MTIYLGLTGGIATGKSQADAYFKSKGYPIVDTDLIAHQLMQPGGASWQKIKDEFGTDYLNSDQTINRKKLSNFVFKNTQALTRLNDITHPLIKAEMHKQMHNYKNKLIIVDVPLLFESGFDKYIDASLLIDTTPELELKRLMARNGFTREQAQIRIDSQMPLAQKRALATYIINNTGTIEQLNQQLQEFLNNLEE